MYNPFAQAIAEHRLLIILMVLIDSSFEYDSNGGQIIKIDKNHVLDEICISGAVI